MTILYIIGILILTIIIWMIIKRKWKALIWTVGFLIILTVVSWYLFLHIISESFGAKCEDNRTWEIEEYVIVEKKCIGFAGPYYYPFSLYKHGNKIDGLLFIEDSTCVIKFKPENSDTLVFDICEKKLKMKSYQ